MVSDVNAKASNEVINSKSSDIKIIYYLLRRFPNYNTGAYCAQIGHATCALFNAYQQQMIEYSKQGSAMRKVVLEVEDEQRMAELKNKLHQQKIGFCSWVEYPEAQETCIAIVPCAKELLKPLLCKLKLFK